MIKPVQCSLFAAGALLAACAPSATYLSANNPTAPGLVPRTVYGEPIINDPASLISEFAPASGQSTSSLVELNRPLSN